MNPVAPSTALRARGGSRIGRAALAWSAFVLVSLALFALAGVGPGEALRGMVEGSFATPGALAYTLRSFVPLALCGLGVALAFRAGLWNIGAEGQFVAGTLAAFAAASASGSVLLALLAGALGGGLWALIAGVLREGRGVPEVLATIMLNFVAVELSDALVRGAWRAPGGTATTAVIPATAELPRFELAGASLHLGLPLALLGIGLAAWALGHTRGGLLLRAVGVNRRAVVVGGFRAGAVSVLAFSLSGAVAGLAGAVELSAVSRCVDLSVDQGLGYTAIAVALLARLRPLMVLPSAALFAVLQRGTEALQWSSGAEGLEHFAKILQGLAILALLWSDAGRRPGDG